MIANLAFSKPFPETAPGPSRSHIYIYTMHPKWLHEVDMAARSPYQRSLLLPIPVSRPSYLCALRNVRRQVLDLCSQRSNIRSLTITVGRQSGVAPTLVSVSEMASSTSCTMRPSSLPQCTDFQQFALPRDNKRLSLKRACSASSFATGCAGCLQTPPASCVRAGDGFLATDARNSPEACCVGLSCVPDPVCMSHSCQLPAGLGP